MRLNKLTAWPLLLTLLTAACNTTPKISPVDTVDGVPTRAPATTGVAPPRYILCSLDPLISYRGSVSASGEKRTDDTTNHLDTDATVGNPSARGTIRHHNAVVKAACGD